MFCMEFLGGEVGSNVYVKWDTFESKSFSVTLLDCDRRKGNQRNQRNFFLFFFFCFYFYWALGDGMGNPKEFLNLRQIFRQSLPKKLFPKICFQVQQEIREDIVVGVIFLKILCAFVFVFICFDRALWLACWTLRTLTRDQTQGSSGNSAKS